MTEESERVIYLILALIVSGVLVSLSNTGAFSVIAEMWSGR